MHRGKGFAVYQPRGQLALIESVLESVCSWFMSCCAEVLHLCCMVFEFIVCRCTGAP